MTTEHTQLAYELGWRHDPILRFLESAPVAVTVVDAQLRLYGFNQRAADTFGDELPEIGRDLEEVLRMRWTASASKDIAARFRQTLVTGDPYVAPLFTDARVDLGREESYEWQVHRVPLLDGSFGVACYAQNVTPIRKAEAVVAEAARRNAFVVELNDRLRPLSEPNAIMAAAAEVFARNLGVAQAGYVEVLPDGDTIVIGGEYSDGRRPTLEGRFRFSDFGEGWGPALHAGHDVVSDDISLDPRGPAGGSETSQAWNLRAVIATPLIKSGRFVAYFYAVHDEPRRWLGWEQQLMHDLAERTWAAVERARAEKAVHDRELHLQALLDHAPVGVYLLDESLRFLHANPLARRVFAGVPDLVGRDLPGVMQRLWEPAVADHVVKQLRHTLRTGAAYEAREVAAAQRGGGAPAYYEWRLDRITLHDGRSGVVCYFRDITTSVQAQELIVATEARYRALFESMEEAVAILDLVFDSAGRPHDVYVVEANPSLERQSGGRGVAGRHLRDVYSALEQRWLDAFAEVAGSGESKRIEGFSPVAGRWFDVRISCVGDAPSRRIAIVYADVSERIRASEVLRDSEERNTYLLQLSDALRSLTDPEQIQRVACRVLGERLGVSRALYGEVENRADSDYYTIGQNYCAPSVAGLVGRFRGADFGARLMDDLRRGRTIVIDDVSSHPSIDPAELPPHRATAVQAYVAVPLIKDQQHVAFFTVHQTTPRRWTPQEIALVEATGERTWAEVERGRAEANLRATEARLNLALEAANMGTAAWYPAEARGELDARALKLFGLPPDARLNFATAYAQFVHPDDLTRYVAAVAAAVDPAGPGLVHEDVLITRTDGAVRWLELTGKRIRAASPAAPSFVGTVADITARKTTEEALRESEERLRESDRRKDEFIAILAHELRNPLAPIRTGLALIRLAGDDARAIDEVHAMMERQVTHMVRLIDDLLDVSRITSGKIQLKREPSLLRPMVQTVLDANRAALTERNIALRVELPEPDAVLDVDPTRFVQVVSNVLHNAVKFSDAEARVEIVASVEAVASTPRLKVEVSDTGAGIPPEMLPRVFDFFTQGSDASRVNTGLGIGLALAKRLVEMHGGTIAAASEGRGRGSTFTIRLPLAAAATDTPSLATGRGGANVRRRVVVIDDNADAADALRLFVSALGADCRVAYDGEGGFSEVLEFQPQLVLLDIGMPRMDGYEACRQIRSALGSNVTIVAVTGWGQENDKQIAEQAGFDAHLTKPVDPALLARLLTSEDFTVVASE